MHWCCGMQLSHKESLGNSMFEKNIPKRKRGRERGREREREKGIWGNGRLLRGLEPSGELRGGVETGFLCVALAILELTLKTRLASNSEIHLPSAGIKGVQHYCLAYLKFYKCHLFVCLFVCFQDRVYIAQSGPKLHACCSEDDDDLKFMILLPPPLSSGTIDVCNHA